jgi:uncharacterized repeat protein (TIGR01451 family)
MSVAARPRRVAAFRRIVPVLAATALALLAKAAFAAPPVPDLSVFIGNSANFSQGDVGDSYFLTVSNVGKGATNALVTVVDALPTGLTATNMTGSGWNCTLATLTCTRSDALAAQTSYPDITLTVDVATNAPALVTNTAHVSGGGETNAGNDDASDPTPITQKVPDLSVDVFHSGTWSDGDVGKTYSIRVDNSNITGASTDGSTVTVVGALSSGLAASAIAGTGWSCMLATLTCTRSDVLANLTTYPLIGVTVNVALDAASPQTASATVSGGGDANAANNHGSDVTDIVLKPDLTIAGSHSGVWNLGDVGRTYTLAASNLGGAATNGSTVTVVDTLPPGLTATNIAGTGWNCTLATLTCTRNDALGKAAAYPSITVTVDVALDAPANMTNTATVAGGGETYTADNTATDPTRTKQIDLVLAKTHAGTWNPGDVGKSYTLTVSNAGTDATDGSGVSVVDNLPAGLSATAIDGPGWSCAFGTLTCTRSDALAANASYPDITLTVTVANDALPTVTNTASVSGGGELDASNDGASDPTTIAQPDLTIGMLIGTPLSQGQGFASYFLPVQNAGTKPTSGLVTVVDTLPAGLTATSMTGSGWTCTLAMLSCTRSDALAAGASYPAINLFVSVDHDAPASVTNSATVSGGGEIATANDSASKTSSVTQKPDLSITKSHAGTWTQGDAGRDYTITVANVGYAATSATTVTVTDTLPGGLAATAIGGSGWSCALATLTCTRSDALANGASHPPITLTVNVASDAPPSVQNVASVGGGGQINAVNDTTTDFTTIQSSTPGIDLAIAIDDGSAGSRFLAGGELAGYTIVVQNNGSVDAHGASVHDTLPANLLDASWTCEATGPASCTPAGNGSIADSVSIPAGAGVTYHLTATVQAIPELPVTNTATVAAGAGETDVNTSNNAATVINAVGIFAGVFDGP